VGKLIIRATYSILLVVDTESLTNYPIIAHTYETPQLIARADKYSIDRTNHQEPTRPKHQEVSSQAEAIVPEEPRQGVEASKLMAIPKVDLRGLDPSSPGWASARAAVTAAMLENGCVVAACDTLGPELRRALFERAMPELFSFPAETKQRNVSSDAALRGYVGKLAGLDFESFNVAAFTDPSSVRDFSSIFWPRGNPEFCDTVISFVSNLLKLEHTVEKMTLDGLGVREESIAGHRQTLTHSLRLSHYSVPEESKMSVTLPRHTDPSFTTAIVQHEVEGLEVQAKDGSWITIPPEADTITIIAGDLLTVVTNGRVPACIHRVKTASNRERFSVCCSPPWQRTELY
jgi:isopenicillin N synthase-like dioxygenase